MIKIFFITFKLSMKYHFTLPQFGIKCQMKFKPGVLSNVRYGVEFKEGVFKRLQLNVNEVCGARC